MTSAQARDYEVVVRNDIAFAEHDGVKLIGDLYAPKGLDKAPVLVGVHGGGWQVGDRKFYRNWGNYLAKNGYAVFAIEYRLMKPGVKTWPGAVYDTKAAVQYVRAQASSLGVDGERIGLIGDSAGAHLAALVALAGEEPLFSSEYRSDPHAAVSSKVKTMVGFYGVYDMAAQWEHDLVTRPRDNIVEKLLGGAPMVNRKLYFDASPMSYVDGRPQHDALSAALRPRGRHRRPEDAVGALFAPAQAGRLLRALDRGAGRRALLVGRSGRRGFRRLCGPEGAAVPRGRAVVRRMVTSLYDEGNVVGGGAAENTMPPDYGAARSRLVPGARLGGESQNEHDLLLFVQHVHAPLFARLQVAVQVAHHFTARCGGLFPRIVLRGVVHAFGVLKLTVTMGCVEVVARHAANRSARPRR